VRTVLVRLQPQRLLGLGSKMGGGEGGRGGGKEREEKKKKRKVEDSYLCYSTDAQQNHILRGSVLSVSHKLSLIKLNGDAGERQGEIIRT
jgi:hypothetical protein